MRNRWTMLAVLFLARTAMSFQFQSLGSLSPFLVPDLRLEYAALGTLIGLYMLSGLVIALPGGVLGRRFGETRKCLLGLVLVVLCYRPPAGAAKPTGAGSLASMFRLSFTGRELALVLLAGSLWSLFNVSFILVVSFAPDFLTAAGHSQTDAGAVVSIES